MNDLRALVSRADRADLAAQEILLEVTLRADGAEQRAKTLDGARRTRAR
ncbi:hypothetical protein [Methylobacterium mesophilicum]|nr:hypothetical protein [Methylobacterium mesophilicum]